MTTRWLSICHEAATAANEVEVAKLEERVAADPGDVEARLELVGAYFLASRWPHKQAARGEHVAWLARHHPEIGIGGYGIIVEELAPEEHAAALAAWRESAAAADVDLTVLDNAASFIGAGRAEEAAALYARAIAREPTTHQWRCGRARMLIAAARGDANRAETLAEEAASELTTALTLTDTDWTALALRIDLLEAYKLAERWDELAETAQRVLEDNERCERTWQYGNAIHDANLALGWCAYVRGEFSDAAVYLRRAGQTPGSPQLDSFGPDFELARAVLSVGQRDAVLAYIEDCARFWKSEEAWLSRCYELVLAGATRLPE